MKKRILMCTESSHIASGFGSYAKNILSRLHATGKYELAELSCGRDANVPKTEPWKIYPNAVDSKDPLWEHYNSNEINRFGMWRFDLTLLDFRPHIVLDIRDFWNFSFEETSSLRPFYHWLISPTYDSAPPKIDVLNSFKNADTLCFHTQWAKDNLIKLCNYSNNNIGPVLNDSIDHNVFKPIQYSKSHHKNKYQLVGPNIIIGSVMRNQKRKLIPDIIETFAELVRNNKQKKLLLYLHTSYPDGLAWDIPSLLLEHNIANNVIFTYVCKKCKHWFPGVFQGVNVSCPKCSTGSCVLATTRHSVTDEQLSEIFNLFDIYVQYATCEGFGIPPLEAAACGVPVITVGHEAMAEVGKNIGATLVNTKRIYREQEVNAYRCYPDNDHLYCLLKDHINLSHDELKELGKHCREQCLLNYSWDKTAKIYEDIFDSIDITKKLDWDCPERPVDTSLELHADKYTNHRQLIYTIVDKIIQEPWLKDTNFIEQLVINANHKYVQKDLQMIPFGIKDYTSILEIYLKNKIAIETARKNTIKMNDSLQSFYEYSKK